MATLPALTELTLWIGEAFSIAIIYKLNTSIFQINTVWMDIEIAHEKLKLLTGEMRNVLLYYPHVHHLISLRRLKWYSWYHCHFPFILYWTIRAHELTLLYFRKVCLLETLFQLIFWYSLSVLNLLKHTYYVVVFKLYKKFLVYKFNLSYKSLHIISKIYHT